MNFSDFIELDVPANGVILRTFSNGINSIVKIDDKEIQELKIRKNSIEFFILRD